MNTGELTLPETNISPKNGCFPIRTSKLPGVDVSGAMNVSFIGRVEKLFGLNIYQLILVRGPVQLPLVMRNPPGFFKGNPR